MVQGVRQNTSPSSRICTSVTSYAYPCSELGRVQSLLAFTRLRSLKEWWSEHAQIGQLQKQGPRNLSDIFKEITTDADEFSMIFPQDLKVRAVGPRLPLPLARKSNNRSRETKSRLCFVRLMHNTLSCFAVETPTLESGQFLF